MLIKTLFLNPGESLESQNWERSRIYKFDLNERPNQPINREPTQQKSDSAVWHSISENEASIGQSMSLLLNKIRLAWLNL